MRFCFPILAGIFCISAQSAQTYPVDGIVVALDAPARTMLVSHRAIGRYMGAMVMPFRVADGAELAGLYPGVRIQFELVVNKDRSLARRVRRTGEPDATIPAAKGRLAIGQRLPDFQLTDQEGRRVQLSELAGKVLAIDFIYTRCPLPDVCPRLSANFATLQKKLQRQLGSQLVLLSVTVDPDFDQPQVLAEYAKRWGADARGWLFLTGNVGSLAESLGELYWTDEGSIGHNSQTAIIGRDGRLAALVDGSAWRIDQMAHLIEHQLEDAK